MTVSTRSMTTRSTSSEGLPAPAAESSAENVYREAGRLHGEAEKLFREAGRLLGEAEKLFRSGENNRASELLSLGINKSNDAKKLSKKANELTSQLEKSGLKKVILAITASVFLTLALYSGLNRYF